MRTIEEEKEHMQMSLEQEIEAKKDLEGKTPNSRCMTLHSL